MMRATRRLALSLIAFAMFAGACSDSSFFDSYVSELAAPTTSVATTVPPILDPTESIPHVDDPVPDPTPLPVDDDVLIGRLPNGLTYYLRSNDSPGASLDLRLVVNAGSAQQTNPDGGTAHFLEHMLFNGTEKFPGNELTKSLERLGIQFGADTNAFTSYDETVYLLGASTTDSDTVATAFDVLAEWASAATLEPQAVEDEIGVVRDELRQSRESADGMIFNQFEQMYTAGSSYEGFGVLGTAEELDAMTVQPLRDFYDRWYRPDNMAVVVVGDMAVDDMLEAITDRFAAMAPRGSESPSHDTAIIAIGPAASGQVFTNPDNAVDNISLDLPLTPWDRSTVGGERLSLIELIISLMIDNILTDGFQSGIVGTSTAPRFSQFQINRELQYFGTNIQADDLDSALTDLIAQLKGAAASGFTAIQLERATNELKAQLNSLRQGADTRQDFEFANDYMVDFLDGTDIDTTDSIVDRMLAILADMSPADATNHWRWILQTGGPIIAAVGSDPANLPSADRLVEIAEQTLPYLGGSTTEPTIESLMDRPEPVDPIDTTTRPGFDGNVKEWEFANGATVIFQPSGISQGRVELSTVSEGGWSVLPDGTRAIADLITSAVANSGLADHSGPQIDRFLSGSTATIVPYIDITTEGFSGSSSADDLETLFQLLNLMITSARIDESAFSEAVTIGHNLVAIAESDPLTQAAVAQVEARTNNSPAHRIIPTAQQLDALTASSALDIYNTRIGKVDRPVIVIVGDADSDDVKELASRYVGTLTPGPHDSWIDNLPPMPAAVITTDITLNSGVNIGGIEFLYSTELDVTAELDVAAHVLETILGTRIIDNVRERLGASYGGTASVLSYYAPDERVDTIISINGDPDRVDEIRSVMLEQISDLVANGPTNDEFSRAVSVLEADYQFVDNQLFASTIIVSHLYPGEALATADNRLALLLALTPSTIRDLARLTLPADRRIEVTRTAG